MICLYSKYGIPCLNCYYCRTLSQEPITDYLRKYKK